MKLHAPGDQPLLVEVLITNLQKAKGGQLVYLTIPGEDDRAYTISLRHKAGDKWGTAYYVNPYSGSI